MTATHKKTLTIATRPGATLTNQPIWAVITADADIGARAQADASDVRFYTPEGLELLWRRSAWSITDGLCNAACMVVLPTVLTSADTAIEIHYGGGADTPAHSSTLSLSGLQAAYDCETIHSPDWSPNGRNLTAYNTPTTQTGKIGQAIQTTATTNYLTSALSHTHLGTTPTLMLWIRPTGAQSSKRLFTIADTQTDPSPRLALRRATPTTTTWYFNRITAFTDTVADDAWTHLALTRSETTFHAYVNGQPAGTYTTGWNDSGTLFIAPGLGGNYSGRIDDFRAYSRQLSAEEIAYTVAQTNSPGTWSAQLPIQTGPTLDLQITPGNAITPDLLTLTTTPTDDTWAVALHHVPEADPTPTRLNLIHLHTPTRSPDTFTLRHPYAPAHTYVARAFALTGTWL